MGLFDSLFGGGQAAAQTAAMQKATGLYNAQQAADPLYAAGNQAINTGYGQAQNIFNPINQIGQGGAQAYADITGAAGQAGQDRARALFQTDPGYQFATDQALKATERTQGTGGFQGSGNVLTALQDRASGLAQQQYGNYVSRLAPFLPYSLGGAQGAAGAYTGQANALNANDLSQAQLAYGTQAGIGSAEAAGTLGAAQAKSGEIGNAINLGGKLLGYAVGGPAGGALAGGFNAPGNTALFGGAGPIFGGTNPNAWYTG